MANNMHSPQTEVHLWLAKRVVNEFPMITGLKFFTLDCGCIYFHRLFRDGEKGSQSGTYRSAEGGPCEVCKRSGDNWENRVVHESVFYNIKFRID